MIRQTTFQQERKTYFPQFVLLRKNKETLRKSSKIQTIKKVPFMHLHELPDSYTIEIIIPGILRENLSVQIHKRQVMISVMNNPSELLKHYYKDQFDLVWQPLKFTLPEQASAAFMVAEYKSGVLIMHIPKTKEPLMIEESTIVVY